MGEGRENTLLLLGEHAQKQGLSRLQFRNKEARKVATECTQVFESELACTALGFLWHTIPFVMPIPGMRRPLPESRDESSYILFSMWEWWTAGLMGLRLLQTQKMLGQLRLMPRHTEHLRSDGTFRGLFTGR